MINLKTKKYIIFFIILIIILFNTLIIAESHATTNDTNNSLFSGGSGTEEDPFQITNASELNSVNEYLDSHFILMNDIEITGTFIPIADKSTEPFKGVFDGNGYIITGMQITKTGLSEDLINNAYYVGLFGYNCGTIKNLGIVNSKIEFPELLRTQTFMGGIVGYNAGIISNVYFSGNLLSGREWTHIGGIAGANKGKIMYAYNTAYITANCAMSDIGGICGTNYSNSDTFIKNCYNIGNIDAPTIYTTTRVGNISASGTIEGCYANSDFHIQDGDIAGVEKIPVSEMKKESTFSNFDFENVWEMGDGFYPLPILRKVRMVGLEQNTIDYAGGDGIVNPYIIENQQHLTNIEKNPMSHYILIKDIEVSDNDYIEDEIYNSNILSKKYFYGVLNGNGHVINNLTLDCDKINSSSSTGNYYAGLFEGNKGIIKNLGVTNVNYNGVLGGASIARYNYGKIENCYSSGKITTTSDNARSTGGLVVDNHGVIANSFNETIVIAECEDIEYIENVDPDSDSYKLFAGGIAANNLNVIINCYNTASIQAKDLYPYCGGIAGNNEGSISNSYNTATINAIGNFPYVGGIAAYNNNCISEVYNTGLISFVADDYTSSSTRRPVIGYAGGIVGHNDALISKATNAGNLSTNAAIGGIRIVGGIAGCNMQNIENTYNSGNINAQECGGIIGENDGTLKYSYNIGKICSTAVASFLKKANGIVVYNNGTITSCYFLKDDNEYVEGTVELTRGQMKEQSNFEGFNFDNIWEMGRDEYALPVLKNVENKSEISLLLGDVNGDDKLNIKDWNMVYNYINETRKLTNEEFKRADVNKDGKVNIKDWNRMYNHITEVNPLW